MINGNRIKHFTDLDAWKEAHKLTLEIYKITNRFPKEELFGLTNQLRRAVISIESCIAEGFYRYHFKDRINFYYDSRGSIGEVQSQLIDSRDLKFLKGDNFEVLWQQSEKVRIILQGLINKTNNLSER